MLASQITTGTSCTMTVPVPMSYPKHLLQRPLSEDTDDGYHDHDVIGIKKFDAEIDEDTEPETTSTEDSSFDEHEEQSET